jgi:hypothetical protein
MPVSLIWHSMESISFNTIVKFPFHANILKAFDIKIIYRKYPSVSIVMFCRKIGTNIDFHFGDC